MTRPSRRCWIVLAGPCWMPSRGRCRSRRWWNGSSRSAIQDGLRCSTRRSRFSRRPAGRTRRRPRVDRRQRGRDPGRTPLFQAAFALQKAPRRKEEALAAFSLNVPGFRLDPGGLSLESLALPVLPGQFDLTLVAAEMDGDLRASLFYDLDLFEEGTAVRMTEWLRNLATGLVAEPGRPAGEVPPWSEAERRQVIEEWGGAEVPSLRPLIPERVAARALETPGAAARRHGARGGTHAAAGRRAHGLAWRLRSMGVGPEVKVTVFAERRPETVAGLLAVLEAGGAYVPLEP